MAFGQGVVCIWDASLQQLNCINAKQTDGLIIGGLLGRGGSQRTAVATAQQEQETSGQVNAGLTTGDQFVLFHGAATTWLVTLESAAHSGNPLMVWVFAQQNHGDSLVNFKQRWQEIVQCFIGTMPVLMFLADLEKQKTCISKQLGTKIPLEPLALGILVQTQSQHQHFFRAAQRDVHAIADIIAPDLTLEHFCVITSKPLASKLLEGHQLLSPPFTASVHAFQVALVGSQHWKERFSSNWKMPSLRRCATRLSTAHQTQTSERQLRPSWLQSLGSVPWIGRAFSVLAPTI